ncbi:MAG TPA: heparan-alpha-glucosaminide N-acetyltransferase [Chloroflexaceae bacterium]|nr:heparan-alpha-glucosaminide N-acetyltransferase [Chloroflexaceae bacterium]
MTTQVKLRPSARFWEVDAARGVAVLGMVFFHFMWDLQFFGLSSVNVFSTPWQIFARSIGTTFTFLLGLSLWLIATRLSPQTLRHYVIRRGVTILGLGLLISLGTRLFVGDAYVRFGILHLLGTMLVLSLPFVRAPLWLIFAMGIAMIVGGAFLTTLRAPFPWLTVFGVVEAGVEMVDYYPLLPWGGAALLGIACGRLAYPNGQRSVALPELDVLATVRALRLLGRHSLLIYLLHQPILLGTLFALQTVT